MSKALPWVLNLTGGSGGGGTVTNPVPDDVIFITADNSTITEDFSDGEVYTIINEKLYNAISSEDNFRVMFVNTGTELDKYTTSIENNIDTETSRLITFNYVDETKDFILEQGEGTNECILTMDFNRYFAISSKANDNVSDRLHCLGMVSQYNSAAKALNISNFQPGYYLLYNDNNVSGHSNSQSLYVKFIRDGITYSFSSDFNFSKGRLNDSPVALAIYNNPITMTLDDNKKNNLVFVLSYLAISYVDSIIHHEHNIYIDKSNHTIYSNAGSSIFPGVFPDTDGFITSSAQTFSGVKTFNNIPKTAADLTPTTDWELVNKKYVDDNAGGGDPSFLPLDITYTEQLQGLTLTNVNVAYTSNSHDNLLAILNIKVKGQECLGYSTHDQQSWIKTAIYNLTETDNTDNYIAFTLGSVVPYLTLRYYNSGALNTKPRVRVNDTIYVKKSEWTAGEILEIYEDSACTTAMSASSWLGKDIVNECVIPSSGLAMNGFMTQCLGYDDTKRQYLTHDIGSGNMTWVDIT